MPWSRVLPLDEREEENVKALHELAVWGGGL